MPWSGSAGSQQFTRASGTGNTGATTWAQDEADGVGITSGNHDTHDEDIAQAINATLKKDGGNSMSAGLKGFDGTAALPGYSFSNDLDTGLYRSGADELSLATGGTQRVALSTTALSTSLPVQQLATNGDLELRGNGTGGVTLGGDALKNVGSVNGASMGATRRNWFLNFGQTAIKAQRGTSGSANGYTSVDMFRNDIAGSTCTLSRQDFTIGQTDVPGNPEHYIRAVVTSSAGAANYAVIQQRQYGVERMAGGDGTITFWAKADAAKDIAVEIIQNFGTGGLPSTEVNGLTETISLTTSWTKYTFKKALASVSGKLLGSNDDDRLSVAFWLDAGSDWNSRTNTLGQQSGTFEFAVGSFVEGDATNEDNPCPVEHTDTLNEIECERYYYDAEPASNGNQINVTAYYISGNFMNHRFTFPNRMHRVPTITKGTENNTNYNAGSFTASDVGFVYSAQANATNVGSIFCGWSASCEL